jgi:hypothetical protein
MQSEGPGPHLLPASPPVLPWDKFADWIGMSDQPGVVQAWLARGYIPTVKIGKYLMVNVALYNKWLLEREDD